MYRFTCQAPKLKNHERYAKMPTVIHLPAKEGLFHADRSRKARNTAGCGPRQLAEELDGKARLMRLEDGE